VRHHDERGVVILVVRHVQEYQLAPVVLLLARADEARDVEPRAEQLQVLHQLVRLVLGVQDACARGRAQALRRRVVACGHQGLPDIGWRAGKR